MISLPSIDLLRAAENMALFGHLDELVVSHDVYGALCAMSRLEDDPNLFPSGLRVVVSPGLPKGSMMIVPARRPKESEEQFRSRCVAIRNLIK